MEEQDDKVNLNKKLFNDEDIIIPEEPEFDENGIPYL